MSQPSISVIIVNWNGLADTRECLASLRRVTQPGVSVLVVDNDSREDEAGTLRAEFPEVCVLAAGANLGFTGGNNLGIRHALTGGADYVLCLNNDTVVAPDFLGPLVAALEADPGAGMAVPWIYYFDEPQSLWYCGAEFASDVPTLRRQGTAWHVEASEDLLGRSGPYETTVATGCALLARASVLGELGGFDDRYFAYFEDVDLSLRAGAHGWRRLVVPASHVWHKVSRSSGGAGSPTNVYYGLRNTRLLAEAYIPDRSVRRAYLFYLSRIFYRIALGSLLAGARGDAPALSYARAVLSALWCSHLGLYGKRQDHPTIERWADRCAHMAEGSVLRQVGRLTARRRARIQASPAANNR